jgi:hypothetical protein
MAGKFRGYIFTTTDPRWTAMGFFFAFIVAVLKNCWKLGNCKVFQKSENRCKSLIINWSQWPGLNRRPTVYETVALPLSYIGCCGAVLKLSARNFRRQGFSEVQA